MEIFTSLTLGSHLASQETDRLKEERTRHRQREMHYMAVCDRLCLHEAVCDACTLFERASLFMCTVNVPEWVCVFEECSALSG